MSITLTEQQVGGTMMRASGWRPMLSGTLQGFFDLLLPKRSQAQ